MQKHNHLEKIHTCDSVHQTYELATVIGYVNACSNKLWKFTAWKLVCRGLTVFEFLQLYQNVFIAAFNQGSCKTSSVLILLHLLSLWI